MQLQEVLERDDAGALGARRDAAWWRSVVDSGGGVIRLAARMGAVRCLTALLQSLPDENDISGRGDGSSGSGNGGSRGDRVSASGRENVAGESGGRMTRNSRGERTSSISGSGSGSGNGSGGSLQASIGKSSVHRK